jgi:hypothetical protein
MESDMSPTTIPQRMYTLSFSILVGIFMNKYNTANGSKRVNLCLDEDMETLMDEVASLSVYIASASQDKLLREELEKHLKRLVKQGEIWHRHKMPPGTAIPQTQKSQIEAANVILCLLSIDFFDECGAEIAQAIARHVNDEVLLIPILLRAVDLDDTPFADLLCLPRNGPPVTSMGDIDAAFTNIVSEIRTAIASHIPFQKVQTSEKVKNLKAMIADHRGFMQDRLSSFVGRQSELAEIQQRIHEQKQTGGYIAITGQAGQGKSSIIAKLIELSGQDSENIAFHFIPLSPGPDHQVGLLRNLMARLILKYDLSDLYLASDNRAALRDYFPKVLQDIAAQGKQEVIFVDGLDQLEEDLNGYRDLSFLPTNPPAGIVFVLGTRPDDTLRPLELLKPFAEYHLPNLRREDFDLILLHRKVQLEKTLADRFYQVMEKNALYLDLAAKELLEAGHLAPDELIAHLANNPNNLFSLSIERFKRQKLEWREVLKPVLGVLLAAREPLGPRSIRSILQIEDERLRDGIQRLGGLLTDTGQHRYTLFHLKLRDYLRQNEQASQKEYVFATDEEEDWHAKLAVWCEQGSLASIWENTKDAREQEQRLYARKHVIAHCYYAKQWDRLFAILDEGSYGRAKERDDVSARSYIEDLDYGRRAAAWEGWDWEKALQHLPHLWRYTLLRCSLRSRSDNYSDAFFQFLLLRGREQEVIGHAELLNDPVRKAKIFLMIADHLSTQSGRQTESKQFLLRIYELARSVVIGGQQAHVLRALVGMLIQTKQWEQAEEVARLIPESDEQAWALSALAEALGQAQRWEQAEEVARSITESSQQAWALSALVGALGQAQRWEEAEEVARSITESSWQAWALSALAGALGQAQKWEQAEAFWEEAEKVARSIPESDEREKTLNDLIELFFKHKKYERGLSFIQRLWLQAETRAFALKVFSSSVRVLVPLKSDLGIPLYQAFQWVDAFLSGKTL